MPVIIAALVFLCTAVGGAQSPKYTLTMANGIPMSLALYVDATRRCVAYGGGSCTTDITPGTHRLEAVDADGYTRRSKKITVGEAKHFYVWTLEM